MAIRQWRDVVMKLLQIQVVPGSLQLIRKFACRDLTNDIPGKIHLADCDDSASRTRRSAEANAEGVRAAFADGDQEMSVGQKFDALDVVGRRSVRKNVRPDDIPLQIGDDNSFGSDDGGELFETRLWC